MKRHLLPAFIFLSMAVNLVFLVCPSLTSGVLEPIGPKNKFSFPYRKVATLDPEGNLVLLVIGDDNLIPILLQRDTPHGPQPADYGFIVINDKRNLRHSGVRNSSPRYILGNRKEQSVLITSKFEVFEKALRSIPAGSVIYHCDATSTIPFSSGLHSGFVKKAKEAVSQAGLELRQAHAPFIGLSY